MAPSKKRGKGLSSAAAAAAAAQEWHVGDLVLAKVKGFPAWPAQVSKPEAFGRHHNPTRVFVVFFGTKQIRFCHHSEISRFTPEARATLIAKTHSKCTPADLRLAVSEICEVAEQKVRVNDGGFTYNDSSVPGLNGRNEVDFAELIEDAEGDALNSDHRNSEDGGVVSGNDEQDDIDADQPVDSSKNAGNLSLLCEGMDQSLTKMKDHWRSFKVHEELGNDATSEIEEFDVDAGWPSPGSNVDSSSLDGNSDDGMNQASKGIVILEKVQTNFASHEELDSFDNFEFFDEEVVNVPSSLQSEEKEKPVKPEKPAMIRNFNWSKQSSRTSARSRKPAVNPSRELPIKFCRKKRRQHTVKAPPQVIVKDDKSDEDHEMATIPEEGSGDSLGKEAHEFTFRRKVTLKKRLRPPSFELKLTGTDTGQDKGKGETCSERSPIAHDPDDYLPIVKRARARAAKDILFDKDQENRLENPPAQVTTPMGNADTAARNGIDLGKGCVVTATDAKLTVEEKCSVSKTTIVEGNLPPKAEKYRKRSSLADGEAALPPSKRLQRALEAMTACAAEAEEDEAKEETPNADTAAEMTASATMCGESVIEHTETSQAFDVPDHIRTARSSEMASTLAFSTSLNQEVASNVKAQPEMLEVLASSATVKGFSVFTKDPEVEVQAEKLEPLASPVNFKVSPFSQMVHEVGSFVEVQSENLESIVAQKTSPEARDTGEVQAQKLEVGVSSSPVSPKIAEVKSSDEAQLERVETSIEVHEIGSIQSEPEKLEIRASSSPVFSKVHENRSTVKANSEKLEGRALEKALMSEDGSSVKAQRASSPPKSKFSSVSTKVRVDKSTLKADAAKMGSMGKASPKDHEDGAQLVGSSSLKYSSVSTRISPEGNTKPESMLKASPKLHADESSVKAQSENLEASPPRLKRSSAFTKIREDRRTPKADSERPESTVTASSKAHEDGSSVKSVKAQLEKLEVRASSPSKLKCFSTKIREDATEGDSQKVENMVMRKTSPKIHQGGSSWKTQEVRTLSPSKLKHSPVTEDGSNVKTHSERLEDTIVRKASPDAREVVSSVKAQPEKLEVRAASPVTRKNSPVSPKVFEAGSTAKAQPEATSSPVMLKVSQAREVGSKAQSEKLGGLTSPDTPKDSHSREIGSSGKAQSEKADKTKFTKVKKNSTNSPVTYGSKHGTDTSSLASERGTTDSHSGESLASESEHTSGRMKSESSTFRTKLLHHGSAELGRINGSGKLDALDLSFVSTTSRFQSEGEVNKVREAYEAAKELKQKLASKDGDTTSSTSMKYLIAAAQSKHILPIQGSMLFPSSEITTAPSTSPSVGPEANNSLIEADNADPSLAPGTSKNISSAHISDGFMSPEAEAARNVFEGLLDVLSRAKESILRATRQAIDCAKLGLSEQVIDIIAKRLETEQSFPRRIDLFFLVDSITQSSHNLKGTPAGVYRSIVQIALPRLLSAAAPPGNFARENRRQCLKVFKLWHERGVFPPPVIRHFMHEIEMHNGERMVMSRRPARNERPVDDPIREMEGMQVDEYGSNASFSLPGLTIPRMFEDEEDVNDGGRTGDNVASEEDVAADGVNAASHEPVERHPHVLEDVDGELEMEDVSPVSEVDTWSRQYVSPASILSGPPLPLCPPPTPPPLPSSPPPGTPPPPPPPSPPQDPAVPSAYREGFCSVSPAYLQHVQNSSMQPPFNRPCDSYEQYNPAIYGCEDGYGMRMEPGYNSYGLPGQRFTDMPGPGPLSPPYPGHHPYGHSFQVNNADFSYQPYGPPPVHPSEAGPWSEPSPRGMRDRFMPRIPDDPYYNPHQEPFHERYGEPGPPDFYHPNVPAPPFMPPRQYEGGYGYHGYPSPEHPMKMGPGPGPGMGRRMPGPYSHGPYPSW